MGWDETYGTTSHSYQHGSVKQIMRPEHVGLKLTVCVCVKLKMIDLLYSTYSTVSYVNCYVIRRYSNHLLMINIFNLGTLREAQ